MSADRGRRDGAAILVGVAIYLAISGASLAIPAIAATTTARLFSLFSLETLPTVPPGDHSQLIRFLVYCCAAFAAATGLIWATPPETPLFAALYRLMTRPISLATLGVTIAALWAIAILPYLVRQQRPPLQEVMRVTARLAGLFVSMLWILVVYDDGPILARIFTPNLGIVDGVIVSSLAFILLAAIYRFIRPRKVDHPQ